MNNLFDINNALNKIQEDKSNIIHNLSILIDTYKISYETQNIIFLKKSIDNYIPKIINSYIIIITYLDIFLLQENEINKIKNTINIFKKNMQIFTQTLLLLIKNSNNIFTLDIKYELDIQINEYKYVLSKLIKDY